MPIFLIMKVSVVPKVAQQFHSFSFGNTFYKLKTKLIANCISSFLNKIIHYCQASLSVVLESGIIVQEEKMRNSSLD